jgi:hypothetical protein
VSLCRCCFRKDVKKAVSSYIVDCLCIDSCSSFVSEFEHLLQDITADMFSQYGYETYCAWRSENTVLLRCVVQCTTFCECVQLLLQVCSSRNIDAELQMPIKPSLAEAEVNVLCTVPGFVKLCIFLKSVLSILIQNFTVVRLIIKPCVAEFNVMCTVPSFVKLHYLISVLSIVPELYSALYH